MKVWIEPHDVMDVSQYKVAMCLCLSPLDYTGVLHLYSSLAPNLDFNH